MRLCRYVSFLAPTPGTAMSAFGGDDVQEKLYDLDEEERRIMEELRELDDTGQPARNSAPAGAGAKEGSPRHVLNALLADCEKEVRSAKAYVKPGSAPMQIVRVVPDGPKPPKTATFLSRPKGTGVDFTVPVTLKEYLDVIKSPIFLNNVRDKCVKNHYASAEDYLEDMRLLARNTATFNSAADLDWVVQHARLLLEAAEEAVSARRASFVKAEAAIRADATANNGRASQPTGKRRRSKTPASAPPQPAAPPPPPAGSGPPGSSGSVTAGARIFVLWRDDMSWYGAKVLRKLSVHRAEVEYDDDRTRQTVDLRIDKWRPMESGAAGGGGARGTKSPGDGPPAKRRKGGGVAAAPSASVAAQPADSGAGGGISRAELDEVVQSISANIDSLRVSLLEEVNSRFDKLERAMERSDAMRRVLLAVGDLSDHVWTTSREMQKSIADLYARLPPGEAVNEGDVTGEGDTVAEDVAGHTEVDGDTTVEKEGKGKAPATGGEKSGKEDDTVAEEPTDPREGAVTSVPERVGSDVAAKAAGSEGRHEKDLDTVMDEKVGEDGDEGSKKNVEKETDEPARAEEEQKADEKKEDRKKASHDSGEEDRSLEGAKNPAPEVHAGNGDDGDDGGDGDGGGGDGGDGGDGGGDGDDGEGMAVDGKDRVVESADAESSAKCPKPAVKGSEPDAVEADDNKVSVEETEGVASKGGALDKEADATADNGTGKEADAGNDSGKCTGAAEKPSDESEPVAMEKEEGLSGSKQVGEPPKQEESKGSKEDGAAAIGSDSNEAGKEDEEQIEKGKEAKLGSDDEIRVRKEGVEALGRDETEMDAEKAVDPKQKHDEKESVVEAKERPDAKGSDAEGGEDSEGGPEPMDTEEAES